MPRSFAPTPRSGARSPYVWWRKDLRKRWSDTRSVRLEDKLNDVVGWPGRFGRSFAATSG